MKKMNKLFAGIALLMATSCVSDPNFKAYVTTDRLDFAVIGLMNYQYLQKDTTLDESAKNTFWRRLNAKEQAIKDAEALLGLPSPAVPVVPLAPLPVTPGN